MDGRTYEVAAGEKGRSRRNVPASKELFPEQAKFVGSYEKRVETLKAVGYLTDDGKLTSDFKVHYGLHRGAVTPELQQVRIDLARHAARESQKLQRPVPGPQSLRGH